MTSQHNTGTHPFYIGMYIHICTHIYVHIYIYFSEGMFMYFSPVVGNPYNGYINPYYWVDDHPLLHENNGSLDPSTC